MGYIKRLGLINACQLRHHRRMIRPLSKVSESLILCAVAEELAYHQRVYRKSELITLVRGSRMILNNYVRADAGLESMKKS